MASASGPPCAYNSDAAGRHFQVNFPVSTQSKEQRRPPIPGARRVLILLKQPLRLDRLYSLANLLDVMTSSGLPPPV